MPGQCRSSVVRKTGRSGQGDLGVGGRGCGRLGVWEAGGVGG